MVNFKEAYCEKTSGNCWGCIYADCCQQWLDISEDVFMDVKREISVALCESRHDIPEAIDGAIFPETISDPMNFGLLRELCRDAMTPAIKSGVKKFNIYVTGLTPALLTVINFCRENSVEVVTHHYDRNSGTYIPLPMV